MRSAGRIGTRPPARWYRGGDARRDEAAVFAQPEWLRRVPTDRRLPERRARRATRAAARRSTPRRPAGWARSRRSRRCSSPPSADIMVCVSHEGETALTMEAERAFGGDVWLVTGKADSPLARDRGRGDRLHARARAVVVPHRELHVRRRGDRRAARRGHRLAPGGGRGGAASSRSRRPRRTGSSSSARAATGRRRRRRRSSCARARGSTRARTDLSSCCTGTWRRSTSRCARTCSRAKGRAAERAHGCGRRAREARLRDDARADDPPGRRHRPLPAPDAGGRRGPRDRPGPDPARARLPLGRRRRRGLPVLEARSEPVTNLADAGVLRIDRAPRAAGGFVAGARRGVPRPHPRARRHAEPRRRPGLDQRLGARLRGRRARGCRTARMRGSPREAHRSSAAFPIGLKDLYAVAGQAAHRVEPAARRGPGPVVPGLAAARGRRAWCCSVTCTPTSSPPAGRPTRSATRGRSTARRAGRAAAPAAALAARMVPAATGTDTAGSLRIPSAVCGTSTLKPTRGAVPTRGIVPLAPTFDHAGPMARSLADCEPLLAALAGAAPPAAADAAASRRRLAPARARRARRRRGRRASTARWLPAASLGHRDRRGAAARRRARPRARLPRSRVRRDARLPPPVRRPARALPPVDPRLSSSTRNAARCRPRRTSPAQERRAEDDRARGSTGSPSTASMPCSSRRCRSWRGRAVTGTTRRSRTSRRSRSRTTGTGRASRSRRCRRVSAAAAACPSGCR